MRSSSRGCRLLTFGFNMRYIDSAAAIKRAIEAGARPIPGYRFLWQKEVLQSFHFFNFSSLLHKCWGKLSRIGLAKVNRFFQSPASCVILEVEGESQSAKKA